MRWFLAAALLCSGCAVGIADPNSVITRMSGHAAPDAPWCIDYTATGVVDGQSKDIAGRACRAGGGGWNIVEAPKGDPTLVQSIYFPPAYDVAIGNAWTAWPPIGISLRRYRMQEQQPTNASDKFKTR
jgi:hypothetical protein